MQIWRQLIRDESAHYESSFEMDNSFSILILDTWRAGYLWVFWYLQELHVHWPYQSGEATLAYGTSDGSIGVVRVNQSLESTSDASFGMGLRIRPIFEAETEEFCKADTRGITALTWVNTCHGNVNLPLFIG